VIATAAAILAPAFVDAGCQSARAPPRPHDSGLHRGLDPALLCKQLLTLEKIHMRIRTVILLSVISTHLTVIPTQVAGGAPAPAGEQGPFYYYLGAPVSLGQRTDTIAVLDREGRRQPADPGVPAAVGR
jgi:hypothetical protein